ncbi:hypothetical protein GGF31_006624 [Allomyces arbusculus]|nr:hypothetical protein GGF31_006624 [Allomyces arbusculus]
MSDLYGDVIKGGLKLKGPKLTTVSDGKIKKKKKKDKKEKSADRKESSSSAPKTEERSSSRPTTPVVVATKTAAEIAFEEAQRKRQRERIAKMAAKSHKEKVDEFNKYLESLSEHHDIPKVGPG